MTAGPPPERVSVPASVSQIAAGRPTWALWQNELGGLTFEVGQDPDRVFVKWNPHGNGVDLGREVKRLQWAAGHVRVPEVVGTGEDEHGAWFVSTAIPGTSAVDQRWREDAQTAVIAIGEGLRAFHDALPVEHCPFSWSADARVSSARRRAGEGRIDPATWNAQHQRFSVEEALTLVAEKPPIDHPVVCHGDTCAPNTLIADDGRWSGHVDLGALGVADRWADLAVATWSTTWNYGPGWEEPLLEAYGIEPDPVRTAYYRLLYDLDP